MRIFMGPKVVEVANPDLGSLLFPMYLDEYRRPMYMAVEIPDQFRLVFLSVVPRHTDMPVDWTPEVVRLAKLCRKDPLSLSFRISEFTRALLPAKKWVPSYKEACMLYEILYGPPTWSYSRPLTLESEHKVTPKVKPRAADPASFLKQNLREFRKTQRNKK